MKSVLFGSAFNPPHRGHVDALRQLLDLGFERVWICPSALHAFGKQMPSMASRLKAVRAMLRKEFPGDDRLVVSDLESRLYSRRAAVRSFRDRPMYSLDMLRHLSCLEGDPVLLAVGHDNADTKVWERFYQHDRILREYGRVVLEERVPIHSTPIREWLQAGNPTAWMWTEPNWIPCEEVSMFAKPLKTIVEVL